MAEIEYHVGVLSIECEKFLAENGLHSLLNQKDESGLVDIFTISGQLILLQVPQDISPYYLRRLVEAGLQFMRVRRLDQFRNDLQSKLEGRIEKVATLSSRIKDVDSWNFQAACAKMQEALQEITALRSALRMISDFEIGEEIG